LGWTSAVDMASVYLPGRLVKAAGLGTGLVTGKVLDVFVLLSTGRLLAERGLPLPLTLVQVGEEREDEEKEDSGKEKEDLGKDKLPVGEFSKAVEELMLIRTEKEKGQVLVADPLVDPEFDSSGVWQRYKEGEEHPWVKKKSSFRGVLSSNLLNSPRLSPTSGGSTPRISRGGLYTIEKERDGERTEWRITPTLDPYPSGEDLARKMGLGLPRESTGRGRFVGGIACLAVYALRAVPLPEEAFRDPKALSKAIVSEFKRTYGLVAEKLLEGTEEEVEERVADLVLKVYPQESSQVGDG
jgi:hypothetical protein